MTTRRPLLTATFFFLLIFFLGVVGYYLLSPNASLIDAIYMTVITISTVGYGEVLTLTPGGKIFTIGLITLSFLFLAYSIKVFGETVFQGEFLTYLKTKKSRSMIQKLNKHTIICGCGRNGHEALRQLTKHGQPVVVIEKDTSVLDQLPKKILKIEGDAQDEKILQLARIKTAANLLVTLPEDAANLYVVLAARELAPGLKIISRAAHQSSLKKLQFAGADHVVMPDKIGGHHMVALLLKPDLIRFLDTLSEDATMQTKIAEIALDNLSESYANKTLAELEIRNKTGCNVIGYIPPNDRAIINPKANQQIQNDGKLIVLGDGTALGVLQNMFLA